MKPHSRRWLLPAMAALLVAYVAAHSPLRLLVAHALGRSTDGCYFLCWGARPPARPAEMAAAVMCLVVTGWAAVVMGSRADGWRSERALAIGLSWIALVAVPAAWVGLIGWGVGIRALQAPIGPLLTALPAAAILAFRGRPRRSRSGGLGARLDSLLLLVLSAVALVLLSASALVGLAHPPNGYDALSYHAPLAVYFWREGDLGSYLDRQPWAPALAHPGVAELWFGLLRIGGGERVANLGQLPFALIGAVAVHVLGRRSGLPARAAALGGLAFLGAPIVVAQAGMQLNDLAAGALVLCAMAYAAAPPARWSTARLAAVGLALGLAVGTKLAVLPAAAGIVLYLALRLRTVTPRAPYVAGACLLGAIAVAPWWVRNLVLYGNPVFPAALPLVGRGYVVGSFARKDEWFVPHELAWPLYPLIEPLGEMSGLGALFAVGALPGVLVAVRVGRRGPLALLALVGGISIVAWWWLTQHEPRLLLGVLGAGFAWLAWSLVAVPRPHRRAAGILLAGAAIFSAAVTVDRALLPLAAATGNRAAFYELEWGIDSVVAAMPERDGLLYHTGHAHRSYAGDYPLLGREQGRSIVSLDDVVPTDTIVALMRGQGYRFAYVPARPEADEAVRAMYPAERFELVRVSTLAHGHWRGTRRYLFRLRELPSP